MDLFQLKCFIEVVEQQSFTKAAFEVSISQSALSKHISKLEDELGVRLFDRSRHLITLTPIGHAFEPYARKMLADYNEMLSEIDRFSVSKHLHIGSVEHMGRVGLTVPISTFLKQFPDGSVTIDIERGDTLRLMDLLVAQKIDLAFIAHIISPFSRVSNIDAYPLEQYRCITLVVDNYHVIVNSKHRFAGREMISWEELANEKLVSLDKTYSLNSIIRDSFRQINRQPNIIFECDQVDTILGLVEEGFGISILSKRIASTKYEVLSVPMKNPIARNTVLVVPEKLESRKRLVGDFVRHVVSYYHENPLT